MKIIKPDFLLNIISKNKSIRSWVKQDQIIKLIIEADEPEKFFIKELLGRILDDRSQLIQLIVNTRKIDRFFNMELLEMYGIRTYELIIASGEQDKYLSLDKIVETDLSNYDVYNIIESTNVPEKYLIPGTKFDSVYGFNIKSLKNKEGIEKYLNKRFLTYYNIRDEKSIIELIELTRDIDKYLTIDTITEFELSDKGIDYLVRRTKMPERFLLPGQELNNETKFNIANIIITEDKENVKKYITKENFEKYKIYRNSDAIVSLIKSTGNIDEYLIPERVKELNLPVYELIKESPNPSKYLFPGQGLGEFKYGYGIENIIYATGKENIDKYLTLEYVQGLSNEKITRLVLSMDNYKKYLFPKQQDEKFTMFNCWYAHLNEIERKRIDKFCEINDDILKYNTFFILDKKYTDLFGEDEVLRMASYPEIVTKVLSIDYEKLNIIKKVIEIYKKIGETDEWTYLFENLIDNYSEFGALFLSISNETLRDLNIETLQNLMLVIKNKNILKITDINELTPGNFEKVVHEKLQQKIYSDNRIDVLNAVMYSKFRITNDEARDILDHYGNDINRIKNEDLKSFIIMIKEIQDADIETLREIYEKVEPVKFINNLLIEKALKKEYVKLYNEKTFNLECAISNKELGENVYELPFDENGNIKDFGMIVSCVTKSKEDYYTSWNQDTYSKSQMFCASYIERGMCGTVLSNIAWRGIKDVIYGFTNIPEDNLVFSFRGDAGTFSESFTPTSGNFSLFESPERIINRGVYYSSNYNEMNFKRFFEGKRIQPSYLVAIKKNNKIANFAQSQEASMDFEKHTGKKLPIIIVDLDKCLIAEKNYINRLIKECKNNYSKELFDNIVQRRKNIVRSEVYDKEECEQFLLDTEIDSIEIKGKEEPIDDNKEKNDTVNIDDINSILSRLSLIYKNKGITETDLHNATKTVNSELDKNKDNERQ